jgi:cyclopropane fatty-acyl-phospholipid synthase-like methyltransferase
MSDLTERIYDWEKETEEELFFLLIGNDYGKNPKAELERIRLDKVRDAKFICAQLGLNRESIVLDLGSGMGFVADYMATVAKEVHCADISRTFLGICQKTLAHRKNTFFYHIPYADLSTLAGKNIQFVYALGVFIHFNLFDIHFYLEELYKLLPSGGKVLLDFAAADHIDFSESSHYTQTAKCYRENRSQLPILMQWNSFSAMEKVLNHVGFKLLRKYDSHFSSRYILLERP